MKPRVLFIAFLLFTIKNVAFSQQQNDDEGKSKIRFIVRGGLSFPLRPDDFSKNWKMGAIFGGGVEFPLNLGNEKTLLLGTVDYNAFPFDEAGFKEGYNASGPPKQAKSAEGPSSSLWSLAVGARIPAYGLDDFFLDAFVGYFSLTRGTVNVTAADNSKTTNNFTSKNGVHVLIGFGVNIPLSDDLDLTLETSYNIAASEQDEPTGYTIFYSSGGSSISRKNTQYLTLKTGIRIK